MHDDKAERVRTQGIRNSIGQECVVGDHNIRMGARVLGDEEKILPRPGLADGIRRGFVQLARRNSKSRCGLAQKPDKGTHHGPGIRRHQQRANPDGSTQSYGAEHPHLGPQEQCGPSPEQRRRRAQQMHVATAPAQRGAQAEQVDGTAVRVADDPLSREDET